MINNLPGPDKGLLDVIFGGKVPNENVSATPEVSNGDFQNMLASTISKAIETAMMPVVAKADASAAAAANAAALAAAAQASPQTVTSAVVPSATPQAAASVKAEQAKAITQDQKNLVTGSPKTEEGLKQVVEAKQSSVPVEKGIVAKTKAVVAPVQKEEEKQVKVTAKSSEKPADLSAAQVNQAIAAALASQSQTQAPQPKASQVVSEQAVKQDERFSATNANGGIKAAIKRDASLNAQGLNGPQLSALLAAQRNNVDSQLKTKEIGNANVRSNNANTSIDTSANVLASPVVLQPVVIQMPLAVPIEAVTYDMNENFGMEQAYGNSNQGASSLLGKNGFSNSQDFVASKSLSRLGVDRPDPRLVSRDFDDRNNGMNLMMPQVQSHFNLPQSGAMAFSTPSTVQAAMQTHPADSSNSNMNIYNSMALASRVDGLASKGGGTLRVKITPENLGEMTISVQNRGNQLHVRFDASSNEARDVLMNSLPELRQALASSRYDVGNIEVNSTQSTVGYLSSTASSVAGLSSFSDLGSNLSQNSWKDSSGQGGNAWDRYFEQRDARQQFADGRQRGGYQRYQQYEMA